ncbi:GrpB family protein [Cohnella sp. WQ 127256]|uniref:GrpB family protein n=1 Tax=Cohnella sp. WQ 127256 TaxID=2938790 RepID=UPI00211998DC|nr:GrpB family protein [Cohnella sp. WQ 127256]
MKDSVIIEPYNDEWPMMFDALRIKIINQIGCSIVSIDHIGSTAIFGLAAKPIIDLQISIMDINNIDEVKEGLNALGFVHRLDNPDLTKRYFRETEGMRRTHIHVRESGSWSEQFSLLFRDYLREHENERKEYEKIKYELANQYRNQRERYVEGKTEIVWDIIKKANRWSQECGWRPSKSSIFG